MILLMGTGEAESARVVHDAIGKLLVTQEGSRTVRGHDPLGAHAKSAAGNE
jgi:hypothetical protein